MNTRYPRRPHLRYSRQRSRLYATRSIRIGYTLLDTQQKADQIEQENERLKIEIAQLKSPARIESIAVEQLHMQVPQNMYFSHEGE